MVCQKALIYAVLFLQLLLKPVRLVLQLSGGFENVRLNVQRAMQCFGGDVFKIPMLLQADPQNTPKPLIKLESR